jgi:hypothetical protein
VFTPSPRAQLTQRVCGPACRVARNRKLARARRRRDEDGYRADECRRQQERREAHASRASTTGAAEAAAKAGTSGATEVRRGCHAPPSVSKSLKLLDDLVQFVDRRLEASRASLLRALRRKWASEHAGRGDGVAAVTRQLPRPSA